MKKSIRKHLILCLSILLVSAVISGCDFMSVALVSTTSNTGNAISRTCRYWSGTSIGILKAGSEDEDIIISIEVEMEKGSLSIALEDEEGNEVYTLEKEGEFSGTEQYTGTTGKLKVVQKGKGFSGSYRIYVGEAGSDEGSDEGEESE